MRHSNHPNPRRSFRLPLWAAGLFVLIAAGCGQTAAPPASPSPVPTPVVTPDPHLNEPVTADQLFVALGSAKLGMHANSATLGGATDVVKVINADIAGWPLMITEFRTTAARTAALGWKAGAPAKGEAPYAFAGLNVLVEFGPTRAVAAPAAPDAIRQQTAAGIVAALDPLLWPLDQHSVLAIPARTAAPAPSAAPPAKPSKAPSKAP